MEPQDYLKIALGLEQETLKEMAWLKSRELPETSMIAEILQHHSNKQILKLERYLFERYYLKLKESHCFDYDRDLHTYFWLSPGGHPLTYQAVQQRLEDVEAEVRTGNTDKLCEYYLHKYVEMMLQKLNESWKKVEVRRRGKIEFHIFKTEGGYWLGDAVQSDPVTLEELNRWIGEILDTPSTDPTDTAVDGPQGYGVYCQNTGRLLKSFEE
ncbi:hypothetical protein [Phaeodactylibacter xiamenensis]|uniref:hypothetical protein n=1 Tax=Phaeodactylibacter xiamenensis TaxID=1524460 RepID=UPI0024A9E856|nr:hypothetical protein [Phaeodactylibacter xiamenensis]